MSRLTQNTEHPRLKRYWRFTLLLLLLLSPLAFGQQQYTEGTCILLQQQIDRYSPQPQSHRYLDSKREFANHCQNPIPAPDKPLVLSNIPVKPAEPENPTIVVPPQPATTKTTLAPAKPAGVMNQILGTTFKMMSLPLLSLLGFLLVGAVIGLLFKIRNARIKGALAERQLYRLLVRDLAISYQHYCNLILETAQGDLTEVDHLVLSPFGIFVIEVKNYKGWVFGSEHQPQWSVQHYRSKQSFQNPLRQNYKHTAAVKFALGIGLQDTKLVHSVVAFSERAEFKTPLPAQVCYIGQVATYIQQVTQPCFSDEQLRQFASKLNMVATKQRSLRKAHKQQVKHRQ
jgi:hypothetical protein